MKPRTGLSSSRCAPGANAADAQRKGVLTRAVLWLAAALLGATSCRAIAYIAYPVYLLVPSEDGVRTGQWIRLDVGSGVVVHEGEVDTTEVLEADRRSFKPGEKLGFTVVAGVGNGTRVILECMDPSNGAVVGRLVEKYIPHDWKGLWRHSENVVVPTDWNSGPGVRYLALRLQVGDLEKSVSISVEAP
jgi:hypothetical protein